MTPTTTRRRADIDNLRSAATFLLLAFHVAKVYDYSPFYHLKNGASFQGFDVFTGFVHQWHMPLFFTLAGWSMAAAMQQRSAAEIRRDRVRRLLIPLVAFSLVACPWIAWIEVRHIHHLHQSFVAFLPSFFGPRFTWSQLWFLAYLLTFSLLYLGRFDKINARRDEPAVSPRTLTKFVAAMIAIQLGLRWAWPGFQNLVWDWANFAYYSAFFVGGFYVGRFAAVEKLVDDHRVAMTRIGLAASAAMLPFWLRVVTIDGFSDWKAYVVYYTLSPLAGVGLVIGIIGWARRHFTGEGKLHAWAKDRAFGVYLLHQICIVACAVVIVRTSWPIAVKFSSTLLSATLLTILVNEAVRRIDWLAPAFGRDRTVARSPSTVS